MVVLHQPGDFGMKTCVGDRRHFSRVAALRCSAPSPQPSPQAGEGACFLQLDAARWMRPDAERWIRPDVARFL